jgi:hypothetical protein
MHSARKINSKKRMNMAAKKTKRGTKKQLKKSKKIEPFKPLMAAGSHDAMK